MEPAVHFGLRHLKMVRELADAVGDKFTSFLIHVGLIFFYVKSGFCNRKTLGTADRKLSKLLPTVGLYHLVIFIRPFPF